MIKLSLLFVTLLFKKKSLNPFIDSISGVQWNRIYGSRDSLMFDSGAPKPV